MQLSGQNKAGSSGMLTTKVTGRFTHIHSPVVVYSMKLQVGSAEHWLLQF
jgi:hypothetical protein